MERILNNKEEQVIPTDVVAADINEMSRNNKIRSIFFEWEEEQPLQPEPAKAIVESAYKQTLTSTTERGRMFEEFSLVLGEGLPGHLPDSLVINADRYEVFIRGLLGVLRMLRFKLKTVTCSSPFDYGILLIIIANVLVLALSGVIPEPTVLTLNGIFTLIFTIEAALKILALGVEYFVEPSNDFDLLIVIVSLYDIAENGLR